MTADEFALLKDFVSTGNTKSLFLLKEEDVSFKDAGELFKLAMKLFNSQISSISELNKPSDIFGRVATNQTSIKDFLLFLGVLNGEFNSPWAELISKEFALLQSYWVSNEAQKWYDQYKICIGWISENHLINIDNLLVSKLISKTYADGYLYLDASSEKAHLLRNFTVKIKYTTKENNSFKYEQSKIEAELQSSCIDSSEMIQKILNSIIFKNTKHIESILIRPNSTPAEENRSLNDIVLTEIWCPYITNAIKNKETQPSEYINTQAIAINYLIYESWSDLMFGLTNAYAKISKDGLLLVNQDVI